MPRKTKPDVLERADEICTAAFNEHAMPGLAVGIVRDGELVYAKGFGTADAAGGRPVTPDTVFRIGSITKTFTAIGLLQLWERGELQLDDAVNRYLKAYRVEHPDPSAAPVTFRHLLTHTSGLGELRSLTDLLRGPVASLGVKEGRPVPSLHDLYAPVLRTEVLAGTKWAYANHGFATLGQLVEDISGEPFAHYVRTRVFEPLGMRTTDSVRSGLVRDRLAQGYRHRRGRPVPAKYLEIAPAPAGSVFSSVNDMASYVAALMNGGANDHGSALKPETLELMYAPHYQVDARLPGVGLAFMVDRFGGRRVVGHDGGWTGFVSSMLVAPDDRVGVVAFTNCGRPVQHLAAKLLRGLLGVPNPADELPVPGVLESPTLWHELAGTYRPAPGMLTNARVWLGFGGEVSVAPSRNHLHLTAPSWVPVRGTRLYPADAQDPLLFWGARNQAAFPVLFRRDSTGRVGEVVIGGFVSLRKVPPIRSLRTGVRAAAGVAAVLGVRRLRPRSP